MEQAVVALIRANIDIREKDMKTRLSNMELADWLEERGWRWLGGRWTNLSFPHPCWTWTFRQALRIQIMRTLFKNTGILPGDMSEFVKLLGEVVK